MTEKIIIRLKHVGTNPMALPVTALVGPAPMPDVKVGERFHVSGTPEDVWWEVTSIGVCDD
jgi:hypothetical protein